MKIVFDIETTIIETFRRKANPFDSRNKVVAIGWEMEEDIYLSHLTDPDNFLPRNFLHSLTQATLLIGFNIKFDLLYYWDTEEMQDFIKRGGKIWDCQLAEYIISGQTKIFPSLDYCAEKYGGHLKDDEIKAFWNQGICTTEIPKQMLLNYLKGDVRNTKLIYEKQLKLIKELDLLTLVELQMDAILTTTEMEYNGMKIDIELCNKYSDQLEKEIKIIEDKLYDYVKDFFPSQEEFLLNSNKQLSAIFFGGTLEFTTREQIGVYKTGIKAGMPRYKLHKETREVNVFNLTPLSKWKTKKAGEWQVNKDVMEILIRKKQTQVASFCKDYLHYRDLNKQKSTYFDAMIELNHPENNIIHHQLVHVGTRTGRLSSRNPNLQNVTRSKL